MSATHRRSNLPLAAAALAALVAAPAQALEPDALFEKVAPSVWEVFTFGEQRFNSLGSGVVIAPGEVVTNCHVLSKAKSVLVRRQNVMYEAKLKHADAPRDLCVLSVANFTAPAVPVAPLAKVKVGQKVYAIGNPKGLEATLSEGLISGLRGEWPDGSHVIQTTAPISPGSSGGGLFDSEGRLIGITTFQSRDGQNLNFALPAEWIAQVAARAEAALAKRSERASQARASVPDDAPPGYPATGSVWTYRVSELLFAKRTRKVAVRADHVGPDMIEEAVYRPDSDAPAVRRTVTTQDKRFLAYSVGSDLSLVEFAPYLLAGVKGEAPSPDFTVDGYLASGDPAGSIQGWQTAVRRFDWENLDVPAGSYRAIHYEISGVRDSRSLGGNMAPTGRGTQPVDQFKLDVWYSPDVGRIVKAEHRTWSFSMQVNDDVAELVEYRAPR